MNDRNKENRKNAPVGALIGFGILALASFSGGGGEALIVLVPLIFIGLIVAAAVGMAKKAGKPVVKASFKGYTPKREKGLEDMSFQPRHPEAIREYNEYAAEENFLRDRQLCNCIGNVGSAYKSSFRLCGGGNERKGD